MLNVGDIVLAHVTGIKEYGFFVDVDGYVGLCHISEVSNDFVDDIKKFVSVGDDIYVLIIGINKNRLTVSIKDINYLVNGREGMILETRKGFLPLKEMLPFWIEQKIKDYENEKNLEN